MISSSLALPPQPLRPPCLTQWERLAQRGMQAAQCGQCALALFSFHQALAIVQALLHDQHHPAPAYADDGLAALVVSHHQLADLYTQAGLPAHAVQHLCRAHRTLMELAHTSDQPAQAQAAWRHSRETHAALLRYLRNHGPQPAITALLAASHQQPAPLH